MYEVVFCVFVLVFFFCVDVCPSTADEEMKVTDHEMCSKKDLSSFPRQTIQSYSNPSLFPDEYTEVAEVEQLYEDLQNHLELTSKNKKKSFPS